MILPHFKQKTTTSQKSSKSSSSASVMTAMIGIGPSDSREVYIFYKEEGVDDQENIRRIMESSCIWNSLESLSFPWVLYSREFVSYFRTLSPKIHFLELLSSRSSSKIYKHTLSHFDKGVLNNSRKALFLYNIYIIYIIYIIILYTYVVELQQNSLE